MPGGGGGGGGGAVKTPEVKTAGPPRDLATYPQYGPVMYDNMRPGGRPPMGGMGGPISSHMPAVDGQMGFGGIPANLLIQALLAGYSGVPSATQAPGAGQTVAPGPMQTSLPQPTPPDSGRDSRGRRRGQTDEEIIARWQGLASGGPTDFRERRQMGEPVPAGPGGGYTGPTGGEQPWNPVHGGWSGDGQGSPGHDFGGYGGSTDSSNEGFARGGLVKKAHLAGPNPAGPDDGHAALDAGEYVVRASQVKKHGPVLRKINAGNFGNKHTKG